MKITDLKKYFDITTERESFEQIEESIVRGVTFSGTNLLVLFFAIVIASVGLNVNSTAVIIGAMLISPLMGPIIGLGLGFGTYNVELIKKSLRNLSFAVIISLFSSTIYFIITPINQAHSELFARTTPNIYDVIIAFFGGLAAITAITNKNRENALTGAAIATALMPPLCTAGYGIATLQWTFFAGAFYLFIINSVFISLATFSTVRFLKFPENQNIHSNSRVLLKRVITIVVISTLIPSIYLGYKLSEEERFNFKARNFIEEEINFDNSYLLNKNINYKNNKIELVIAGKEISNSIKNDLNKKLILYGLKNTNLIIKNTLSFQSEYKQMNSVENEKINYLQNEILNKQGEIATLQNKLNNLSIDQNNYRLIKEEVLALYSSINDMYISKFVDNDSTIEIYIISLELKEKLKAIDIEKLIKWLTVKFRSDFIKIFVTF